MVRQPESAIAHRAGILALAAFAAACSDRSLPSGPSAPLSHPVTLPSSYSRRTRKAQRREPPVGDGSDFS